MVVPIESEGSGDERLAATGFLLLEEDGIVKMDEPSFDSPFGQSLSSFDFYGDDPVFIKSIQAPASQLPKEIIFIPALGLVVLLGLMQRTRVRKEGEAA